MFHIFSAIALVAISTVMVGAGMLQRSIKGIRLAALTGLIVTLSSGVGLLVLGASLGHFCATMTLVTVATVAARSFYLSRVPSAA